MPLRNTEHLAKEEHGLTLTDTSPYKTESYPCSSVFIRGVICLSDLSEVSQPPTANRQQRAGEQPAATASSE